MALVAERAKYEAFLAALEKDSASKPANVVARVRADYSARLQIVAEKLREHRGVLTQHAATLATQLQKLKEAEQRFLDEAAELDLRKQVGELPDEEWASAVQRVMSDAAKLKAQQAVTDDDIKRIRDVLGALPSSTETPRATPAVDEIAFLKAVVGPTSGVHTTPPSLLVRPTPPAAPETPSAPVTRTSTIRPIGPPPRPSTVAPRTTAAAKPMESLVEPDPMSVPSTPAVQARPSASEASQRPTKEALIEGPPSELKLNARVGDDRPLASNVPDGDLKLRARGVSGAKKTLKCPSCGALNNPSEWYCSQCGAELAQV